MTAFLLSMFLGHNTPPASLDYCFDWRGRGPQVEWSSTLKHSFTLEMLHCDSFYFDELVVAAQLLHCDSSLCNSIANV